MHACLFAYVQRTQKTKYLTWPCRNRWSNKNEVKLFFSCSDRQHLSFRCVHFFFLCKWSVLENALFFTFLYNRRTMSMKTSKSDSEITSSEASPSLPRSHSDEQLASGKQNKTVIYALKLTLSIHAFWQESQKSKNSWSAIFLPILITIQSHTRSFLLATQM